MSFSLKTLTEGIRDRHVGQQNQRLVEKWSRTGLLRGMEEVNREVMATLLENQAAQVLRESNTMSAGDVGGFTNIAFPIVRRVFGGLIANELVSIQPMSLPSGLLFYLDYTYGSNNGAYGEGESIYGGPTGKAIQGGADAIGGQYDLVGSGFTKSHKEMAVAADISERLVDAAGVNHDLTGVPDVNGIFGADAANGTKIDVTKSSHLKLLQHDPQILDRINDQGESYSFFGVSLTSLEDSLEVTVDRTLVKDIILTEANGTAALSSEVQAGDKALNVRRLTQIGLFDRSGKLVIDPLAEDVIVGAAANANNDSDAVVLFVVRLSDGAAAVAHDAAVKVSAVKADTVGFAGGEASGKPSFESDFGGAGLPAGNPGDPQPEIPEIDIKIESIPVTAQTRKLRARWSPELAQDLNAYHSMDAEVELTQILSEQIALEIDREILGDLLTGAKGANFFWSRSPGKFVNKRTGAEIARSSTLNPGPAFTGTVREWYETLTETVIDVANEIHRKTLRGSANFIVVSPDVATVLEASVLYRPSYSLDGDGQVGAPFTMGAEKMGTLSNRFTVYKDPYFPRNKILVGYKGGSYLETGFVYAPYVPLIVTPTIFQPEDFTPRKGVMTRYGKKMVRADFYGTVTCLDMNVI